MIARQLGAVARCESEQTAGRTRAGKADAASRGAWQGGQRVYGYELVPLGAWVRKGQQADGGLGVPQRDGLGT